MQPINHTESEKMESKWQRYEEFSISAYPPDGQGMQLSGHFTGVKVIHISTGIESICDCYRQMAKNKATALSEVILAVGLCTDFS